MLTLRSTMMSLVFASIYAAPALSQISQTSPVIEKRHVNAAQNGVAEINQQPDISPLTPEKIAFENGFKPGSVIVDTAARKLFFTLSANEAFVYPVAVGKPGFAWAGVETVTRISNWPVWVPPAEMRQRKPSLPERMAGGINNPLGAKAIYLGDTLYRIHGTNVPSSIGSAASSGCIRMLNGHIVHLSALLTRGTTVFVVEELSRSGRVMPPAVQASATLIDVLPAKAVGTQVQMASR